MLSAYLDGELTDAERAAVEQRLASDPAAQQVVDELRAVSKTLRGLPPAVAGGGFTESVLRRVEAAQRVAPASSEDAAPTAVPTRLPFGRSPRAWLWAGLAVAAALMLTVVLPDGNESGPTVAGLKAPASAAPAAAALDDSGLAEMEAALPAAPPAPAMTASSPTDSGPAGVVASLDGLADESLALAEEAEESPRFGFVPPSLSAATESPQLFVRVQLRDEAFNNRFVDRVLTENGFLVEPAADEEPDAEMPRPAVSSSSRSRRSESLPVAELGDRARSPSDADVLMVDGQAPQVAACLNYLKNDALNCVSIYVCPTDEPEGEQPGEPEPSRRASGVATKSVAPQQQGNAWQLYNRGVPVNQEFSQLRDLPQQQARGLAAPARAYRLPEPLRRQVTIQSRLSPEALRADASQRGAAGRSRSGRLSNLALLPAPTDDASRVQALLIVEADDAESVQELAEESPAEEPAP